MNSTTKNILAGLVFMTLLAMVIPTFTAAQGGVGAPLPSQCAITRDEISNIKITSPAGQEENCPNKGNKANLNNAQALCCAFNAIFTVTDWIFWIIFAVVIVLVLIGAFYITTAGGDPGKVGTGRNFIIYAAVGLIVALAARAVPGLARAITGL